MRFRMLWDIARGDLELARLAEAHHDAHAIAADLDFELSDGLYAVWAATGAEPLVATPTDDGYALAGVVPWCTGNGIVDRALVAAKTLDQNGQERGLLLDIRVEDGTVVATERPWISPAFSVTGTASLLFEQTVPSTAVIGAPDSYFHRSGFWHGAVGVAACWYGGLRGLLDCHLQRWRRADGHSLAHLASASAWADAMEAVLYAAACDIDANPADMAVAEARARSVRHVVERGCVMAMDSLAIGAGPEPLAFDPQIVARTQQLQLYVRQCHGERDLEPLGRYLLQ
jgi:alkylation response protein AidB-like acyl-CoA dehydrogenase